MASIADDFKAKLEQSWEESKDPARAWEYTKMMGTLFIQYVNFSEKVMLLLKDKVKKLEKTLAEALGEAPAQQNGTAEQNGNAAPPPAKKPAAGGNGRPGSDMVRLGGDRQPMSAEEQAAEEAADLQFNGEIDQSQYVPRSSVLGGGAAQPPPAAAQ